MPGMQTGGSVLVQKLISERFFSAPSRLARTMWSPNLGMMQAWHLCHSAAVIDQLISMLKCFPALHCVVFSSLNMFDCSFCDWRSCQEFSRKTSRKEKGGMIGGLMIAMAFCPVHAFVSSSFFAVPLSFYFSPHCLAGNGEHTSLMGTWLQCKTEDTLHTVDWKICWSGCEQEGRQVQRGLDTGIACEYCIESTLRSCQLEEQERDMRARHAEKLKAWSVR